MKFDPAPDLKKGLCFLGLIIAWIVYLFFDPFSALATGVFLTAAIFIALKEFK